MNKYEKELIKIATTDNNIYLHKNIPDISKYMRRCRYAVSAGGTTLYELCACRIPTVCFSFSDNQVYCTSAMNEQQIMIYAGDARVERNIEKKIMHGFKQFKEDDELTEGYITRMGGLIDGKGVSRIVDILCN